MSTPDDRVMAGGQGGGGAAAATPPGAAEPLPGAAESLPGAAFDLADLDNDVILPRVRRKRLPFVTALLALSAVAGAGVVGGILIQKQWVGTSAAGAGGGGSAAFAAPRAAGGATGTGATGTTPGGGGRGGGAGGFSGTSGTVKLIDGTTLYVTDPTGNVVKVTTVAGITVRVAKDGTLKDIHPGDTVVVQGTTTGGVVAATSVSMGGAGGGFGRGGGFGGRGGGAGAGGSTGTGTATATPGIGGSSQPALPGLGG